MPCGQTGHYPGGQTGHYPGGQTGQWPCVHSQSVGKDVFKLMKGERESFTLVCVLFVINL